MKIRTVSLLVLLLVLVQVTDAGATEPLKDIKHALLKIISSVPDQDIFGLQKDDSESRPRSAEDDKSIRAPLSVSALQVYFPMNPGDTKDYEGSIYGGFYYSTYNYSQVFYNGRTCYLETDSLDGSRTYYGYSGTDLQMLGGSVGSDSYPFNSPLRILNDSVLSSGGSLQSSTSLTVQGIPVNLSVMVNSTLAGFVTIPLGSADHCRAIDMTFTYSIPGESETLEVKDVWILAPNIGKLKIAVLDEFLIQRGWLSITGGTVEGKQVAEILNPTMADFVANLLYGFIPLAVSFTDRSTGAITNWLWDFGDGTSSVSRNPSHVYSKTGTYTVSLTVSSTGASDAEIKSDYIRADDSRADVNNDKMVDLTDAVIALQLLSNLPSALGIGQEKDVNGDNRFGMEEVLYILQNISRSR